MSGAERSPPAAGPAAGSPGSNVGSPQKMSYVVAAASPAKKVETDGNAEVVESEHASENVSPVPDGPNAGFQPPPAESSPGPAAEAEEVASPVKSASPVVSRPDAPEKPREPLSALAVVGAVRAPTEVDPSHPFEPTGSTRPPRAAHPRAV